MNGGTLPAVEPIRVGMDALLFLVVSLGFRARKLRAGRIPGKPSSEHACGQCGTTITGRAVYCDRMCKSLAKLDREKRPLIAAGVTYRDMRLARESQFMREMAEQDEHDGIPF